MSIGPRSPRTAALPRSITRVRIPNGNQRRDCWDLPARCGGAWGPIEGSLAGSGPAGADALGGAYESCLVVHPVRLRNLSSSRPPLRCERLKLRGDERRRVFVRLEQPWEAIRAEPIIGDDPRNGRLQTANDGGLDGVISLDKLGLEKV